MEISDQTRRRFEEIARYVPGGYNTSLRATDPPLVFTGARGAYLTDADGRTYVDYHCAFGAILAGHCEPEINRRALEVMTDLDLVGVGTTELEGVVARKIVEHVPSAEQVLFCNSGSEATFHAVRLARAVTGRKTMVKFQGCYHGWHDYLAMNVITPAERMGDRDLLSAGMLPEAVEHTLVLPFNDVEAVTRLMEHRGDQIAGIILEPIAHNIGAVPASLEFLTCLRELTRRHGALLIFDEVVTGFRHALGGYQSVCGVTPDVTALGKAIANGFPLAAVVGRRDLMQRFNTTPTGDVFFAGTFNAHPMSLAAALATIERLEQPGTYERLFRMGEHVRSELNRIIGRLGLPAQAAGFGSVWLVYFLEGPVRSYSDLLRNDRAMDLAFRWGLVERGIFSLPTALKRNHFTLAHTDADVSATVEAAETVLKELATGRTRRVPSGG